MVEVKKVSKVDGFGRSRLINRLHGHETLRCMSKQVELGLHGIRSFDTMLMKPCVFLFLTSGTCTRPFRMMISWYELIRVAALDAFCMPVIRHNG